MIRALIIYAALSIAYLIIYGAVVPRIQRRRARQRYDARLRAMTPDELAAEAREYAKWAGYDRAFGDATLFRQPDRWSPTSLARALEDLYARAAAQDLKDGKRGGPGSQVFFFYDSGLASVLEILEKRPDP